MPGLVEFLLDLDRKENLYALKVSREFLRKNGLEDFMNDVSEHFMGDLIDVSLTGKKPFFMPPRFDIREEVNRPQRRTLKNVSKDSLFSIAELTFFVNSRCHNNCTLCHSACKQFLWCTRENQDNGLNPVSGPVLEITEIEEILDQTKGCPIKTVNIIGGDLTQYPHLTQLVDLLRPGSFNVNYYFHFSHLRNGVPHAIRAGGPQAKVTLLADCSALTFPHDLTHLKQLEPDRLIFLIQREDEIAILEDMMEDLKTANISVQPCFNGDNLDFFKANVFTDPESLTESIPDMETINARKSYNTLNYGKMFINSNKNIYSDLNGAPLGKAGEMSMETAVVSELSEHGNWLKIRRDVEPCGDCLLNSLCPPLSNFETATGINNSCTIWNHQGAFK
ncbi:MAG: TIGR04150 pseudo-rSAM protein [bacterium]|nr:TIGR04150 pseudo-rSAM protein [bacterium]